jgi:hypothetical protein
MRGLASASPVEAFLHSRVAKLRVQINDGSTEARKQSPRSSVSNGQMLRHRQSIQRARAVEYDGRRSQPEDTRHLISQINDNRVVPAVRKRAVRRCEAVNPGRLSPINGRTNSAADEAVRHCPAPECSEPGFDSWAERTEPATQTQTVKKA